MRRACSCRVASAKRPGSQVVARLQGMSDWQRQKLTATNDFRSGSAHDRMVLDVQNLREVGPMEAAGLLREGNALAYKRLDPAIWRALDELAGGVPSSVDGDERAWAAPPVPLTLRDAVARERNRFFPRFRSNFDAQFQARRAGSPRAWGKGGGQVPTLALVDESDLTGQVSLKQAVQAMREATRKEGFGFDLRTRAVMREQPSEDEFVNPWGAEFVCDALGSTCRALLPDKADWHRVMEHLVRALTPELVLLNKEQDALFLQHDILPILQVRMRKRVGAGAAANAAPDDAGDLFHQVAAMFAPAPPTPLESHQAAPHQAANAAPTEQQLRSMLMHALYMLDARSAGLPDPPPSREPNATGTREGGGKGLAGIARTVAADGGPKLDPITINILTAVLNEVFDNPYLPAAIKTLFGRLQIPMLKAALIDRGVLAQPGHGVRRFFDALAAASVGLRPDIDEDARFIALANRLVADIGNQPAENLGKFSEARAELEAFLDAERALFNANLEQALPPLVALDEQIAAMALVRTALAVHLAGKDVPPEIRAYLNREGVSRLAALKLRDPPDDAAWQLEMAWIDDLVWSVAPGADPHARQRLVPMVPRLVRAISEDWPNDAIGAAQRKDFLAWLFEKHVRAMTLPPDPAPATDDMGPPTLPLQASAVPQSSPQPGAVAELDALLHGDWCAFDAVDDAPPLLARFAWRSPHGTQLLFTHRDGAIAVLHTPESLAAKFRAGSARVVFETASLFDRAMERMIAAPVAAEV